MAPGERKEYGFRKSGHVLPMVELRDDLDATLQRMRSERHICPPVFGVQGEGAEPQVSVRAMIVSLTRFGIAAGALEKDWAAYSTKTFLY